MDRLTVNEAADRLGISKEAVRKRVQRGTLPHAKQSDGHIYVYVDSEGSAVGQESAPGLADQIALNYLDKLYNVWQAIDTSYKRFTFLTLAASILVLALSGGAVSTEEKLTISGIGLKIPFVVFMTAGAILPAIFIIVLGTLEWVGFVYSREISRLYKSLGLDDSIMNSPADPFMFLGSVDAIAYMFATEAPALDDDSRRVGKRGLNARGEGPIFLVLLLIVPTAAQAGAGYKISQLLDKTGPGWLSDMLAYLWLLPRQGSSWVSDLFVILAFATTVALYWQSVRAMKAKAEVKAGVEAPPKNRIEFASAYLFVLLLACLGVRLGHFVAV